MSNNILQDKSFKFALRIISMQMYLIKEKREYVLSKQVVRSGTAIGALIEEANQAESMKDFIHKLSIANKEANETHYWLRLFKESALISQESAESIIFDCRELIKILIASIKTSKKSIAKAQD